MTKDEALLMALEALEYEADKGNDNAYQRERDAIKQVLAAPVQPMAHIVGEIDHAGKVWKPAQRQWVEVEQAPVQEPVACVQDLDEVKRKHLVYEKGMDWKDPLYTAPPAAPVQEPVAYDKTEMNCFVQELYDRKMCEGKHGHYETMFHCVHQAIKRVTPPTGQRQPLTDEQIDDIWNRYCDEMGEASINDAYDIARAIEAAHGITGEKK